MTMVTFKEVTSYIAVREIYRHKVAWDFLHTFVEASEEVEEDESGDIYFIYYDGKSVDKNYFTNDGKYFWIAGYDNNKICFLQLMQKISSQRMELVVAQKRRKSKEQNLFNLLVDYIANDGKYNKVKKLYTFPMNGTLKAYYMAKGFEPEGKELKLDIR